jgi:hypothetical protein
MKKSFHQLADRTLVYFQLRDWSQIATHLRIDAFAK